MALYSSTSVRPGPLGQSVLMLEGQSCGIVRNVSGGAIVADLVSEKIGPDLSVRKRLGGVRYEEFELDVGFAMAKPLFDWIDDTWQLKQPRRSGSVLACTEKLEVKAERKFQGALLTQMAFPTLDGSSKEPAFLRLRFAPELITYAKASGKGSGTDPHHPEKQLVPSQFELKIDGLDCKSVQKIESFTVRQVVAPDALGKDRISLLEPASLDFPNLRITFSEVSVDSWLSWFDAFVVQGNCGEENEKSGTLTLYSPNRQPLATLSLFNLGIFRLGSIDSEAAKDSRKLARAELYCERMRLKLG